MRGRSELKAWQSTAMRATTAKRVGRRRVVFFSRRGFFPHRYSLVIISIFFLHFMLIRTFYARFMLICAFYADQANYKNSAFNAYHQVNAVSCLSARLMLSSRTIRRVSCLSLWTKLEIALSRNDHFFGNGLSSSSFLFPPNVKHDVLDTSVLFSVTDTA